MVETVTQTVPDPAGTTTVSEPELVTSTPVPAALPKSTVVEPETNPLPVTVTVLVPLWGPLFGVTVVDRRRRRCRCRRWPAGSRTHQPVVETVTETVPEPAGTLDGQRAGVGHVDRGALVGSPG